MVPKEFLEKAKKCNSKEELLGLAKLDNVELSEDEIKALLASSETNRELSDEELENVNGGTCFSSGVTNPKNGIYREYAIVSPLNSCPLNSLTKYRDTVCANCDDHFIDGATWYCSRRWKGHNKAIDENGVLSFVDD